ncbi:response regulator [Niveibacterium sp. 24ML]|uniref:response regulator n=1 Tax=Niveibacterium sp. 24ML TaxID=2985512 RepID=UPI00226FC8C3|nr:response regulator [Niveibacterium sp. 24ML]MCX9155644.1 response regulator [Niveibacterium sp. 24ML]
MRVLLVEDDPMVGDASRLGLLAAGFTVDWVRDGRAAELAIEANRYAASVLDLGLPKLDGMALLARLRGQDNRLPVIVVTARDAVSDRVAGLNAGADDYLTKPFDLDELIARLRALIRRNSGRTQRVIHCGAIAFDTEARSVTLAGEPVALSARELSLLEILLEQPGAVLSREKLEERLFGWGDEPSSNALEVHLHHLRRKLGAERIRNIRGIGYKVVG